MVRSRFPDPITAELDDVVKPAFALVKGFGGPRQFPGLMLKPAELNGNGSAKDGKADHHAKNASGTDGRLRAPSTRGAVQIPPGNAGSDEGDRDEDNATENKHSPDIGERAVAISRLCHWGMSTVAVEEVWHRRHLYRNVVVRPLNRIRAVRGVPGAPWFAASVLHECVDPTGCFRIRKQSADHGRPRRMNDLPSDVREPTSSG